MQSVNVQFFDVSFSYNSSPERIVSSLNLHFTKGWTGIVGPNGVGKTTVLKLAVGILPPSSGHISGTAGSSAIYCAQETEHIPDAAEAFIFASETYAGHLRSMLSIRTDWIDRWNTLSHGERKRFQIGIALWSNPDILALDEPTNHLDDFGKNLLRNALLTFNGTGLIVSHDRMLLDSICRHCLFMRPAYFAMHNGGFTAGDSIEFLNDATHENNYTHAIDKYHKTERAARLLKQRESAKENSLSKRNIAKHDHDAKSKIDLARLSGKDKQSGRKVRLLENRSESLKNTAISLYFKRRETGGIIFQGESLSCDRIIFLEKQIIRLCDGIRLNIPDLILWPESRIAVTGNNGVGKSIFISHIINNLKISHDKFIYVPQEIGLSEWSKIKMRLADIDNKELGLLFTAIYRLGSEPERILFSDKPSPGEKRKIVLGLGLLKSPGLIIMDEPTNHMDIPSIKCLEKALLQFNGAIITVSHDRRFLEQVTQIEWNIIRNGCESELFVKM
jgi:macrolide transport system ATP-binding/permease protein